MLMPPALLALLVGLQLVGAASAARTPPAKSHAAAVTASHVQITQVEYRLMLSRGAVKAGPVSLQAIDRGSDPHDLRLLGLSSHREVKAPQLTPGQRWNGVVYLAPGRYHLWCSLPEHAKRGMRAMLTVVR
jgi:uncharacterized cupredoxin-like copper-binding protein